MKASALFGAGWEDDSLEVLWQDTERVFCRLWRDDTRGDKHAFIPVTSGADHPILESTNRLTHEYELQRYLDRAWALRPLELLRDRGQTMLVVEQGSLYPAVYRIEQRGWISSKWGTNETGRKAKFYTLTRLGQRQLVIEERSWDLLSIAIAKVRQSPGA